MVNPNIIFILADDLGWADLGCFGARDADNQLADTSPRLDALARRGMRWTRAYANSAVCSPTRFALMTGRWQYRLRGAAEEPLSTGSGDKVLGLPTSHPTLPSMLAQAGYATALIGKWHLGYPPHFGPRQSGYGYFYGFHAGAADYFARRDSRGNHDFWENETPIEPEGYLTDLLSRRAADFVLEQDPAQPFFLSLHYSAPHWPWMTRDDRDESRRIAGAIKHIDGGSVATYQRMIHHMDEGIGWVLDALESQGLTDNTIVIFTSDNGGERYSNNWPLVGQKMDLLEGGIRVPVIASWPRGIPMGQTSTQPHLTMDWTATLLEAAGVVPDATYPLDGLSLMPLFAGQTMAARPMYWRMKHRQQAAMIEGDWKYLRVGDDEFLFNLAQDPRERANRVAREPARLARMRDQWARWNASLPPIPPEARSSLAFTERDLPRPSF